MEINTALPARPRLFIGSSTESLHLAQAIQANLADVADATVWNQGVFSVGKTMLDILERRLCDFDYAALVMTPDRPSSMKAGEPNLPAGNILVEAGLFLAHLGHSRTFLVCPDAGLRIPSDLQGLIFAKYAAASNGHPRSVLAPACSEIAEAIRRASAIEIPLLPGQVARRKRCSWVGTAITGAPDDAMRIVNLSVTGAFLETGMKHPQPGDRLELHLSLRGDVIVSLDAEVVRIQVPSWKRIGGVGVRFTGVDDAARRRLEEFVEHAEAAA